MARINVEDSLYRDIRFHDLVQKMGGVDAALGSVVRAWSVAQDYWLANGVGIPLPVWKSQRLRPEVLEVGLAEMRGEFVYVRGSEEQFAWLVQRSQAGRGKRGGVKVDDNTLSVRVQANRAVARAIKDGVLTRPETCELCESGVRVQAHHEDYSKPLEVMWLCSKCHGKAHTREANTTREFGERKKTDGDGQGRTRSSISSSISSSSSLSFSDSNSLNLAGGLKPTHAEGKTVATWEAYREAYRKRYGTVPVRNAAVNGKLSQFVSRLGSEEAPLVAEFYLTHNAFKYVNAGHSVGMLLMDAEKLRTEWATGNKMLGTKAQEIERTQHNLNAWDRAAEIVSRKKAENG